MPSPSLSDRSAQPYAGSRLRQWAEKTWAERDQWLDAPGGVEAVFSAAQVLGCRAEALAWLSQRTRGTA
jgi:hypothetical protein